MKKNHKIRIIFLICLVVLCAGGVLLFVAKARSEKSTKPNQSDQAKNTNTYQQNVSENNPSSAANTTSQNIDKPKLTKGASTAPNNVPIDINCWGKEGNYCQITLVNSKTNQTISLDKTVITTDKANQSTAHWVWTTQIGIWQVTAVTTDNTNNSASSDPQTIEVK